MASEGVQRQAEVAAKMDAQEIRLDNEPCWKKKEADGGFFANMKDHFNKFVNTPMDQHKICLKKTFHGVGDKLKKTTSIFGSSDGENNLGAKEEDSKQVQTTTTH